MNELSELLDHLVPTTESRSNWADVVARRARQRRERALRLTAVVVAAMLVMVPTAWAVGLFRGTPAPQSLKRELLHANEDQVAQVLGIMRDQPGVDAAKTHGVIELQTQHGPLRLWAAPVRPGGHCLFLQMGEPPEGERPVGITKCEPGAPPPTAPPIEGEVAPGSDFRLDDLRILHGWVRSELLRAKPTRLTLTYADGSDTDVQLVEDYFLALVPKGKYAQRLTVHGADGEELGSILVEERSPVPVSPNPTPSKRPGPKLIEVTLSNGWTASLYAQPRGGPCFAVEVSDPAEPSGLDAGETCGDASGEVSFGLQGFGPGPGPPAGVLLEGYAEPAVARVELQLEGGRMLPVPITKGYILFELPKRPPPRAIVSYDSSGDKLGTQLIYPGRPSKGEGP